MAQKRPRTHDDDDVNADDDDDDKNGNEIGNDKGFEQK